MRGNVHQAVQHKQHNAEGGKVAIRPASLAILAQIAGGERADGHQHSEETGPANLAQQPKPVAIRMKYALVGAGIIAILGKYLGELAEAGAGRLGLDEVQSVMPEQEPELGRSRDIGRGGGAEARQAFKGFLVGKNE